LTTRDNSLVLGVGNDWDSQVHRTVGTGQAMVHEYLSAFGDTWWVQRLTSSTPTAGSSVTVNDTVPTTDRWNLTIVEVLAPLNGPQYSISGTLSPAAGGSGATVNLSGAASASATADGSGNFTFNGLANGSYTVTPSKVGYAFTPASRAAVVDGASVAGVSFTATAATFSVAGTISPAAGGSGATVNLSGAASASATADGSGNFTFNGLANGSYTVTSSKAGYALPAAKQRRCRGRGLVLGDGSRGHVLLPDKLLSEIVAAARPVDVGRRRCICQRGVDAGAAGREVKVERRRVHEQRRLSQVVSAAAVARYDEVVVLEGEARGGGRSLEALKHVVRCPPAARPERVVPDARARDRAQAERPVPKA
jgi:hypothetical protein